jgi:hypothetical protein
MPKENTCAHYWGRFSEIAFSPIYIGRDKTVRAEQSCRAEAPFVTSFLLALDILLFQQVFPSLFNNIPSPKAYFNLAAKGSHLQLKDEIYTQGRGELWGLMY